MNVEVYNPDEDVESYPDLLGRDYAALLQRGLDLHSVRLLRSQHSLRLAHQAPLVARDIVGGSSERLRLPLALHRPEGDAEGAGWPPAA